MKVHPLSYRRGLGRRIPHSAGGGSAGGSAQGWTRAFSFVPVAAREPAASGPVWQLQQRTATSWPKSVVISGSLPVNSELAIL